MRTETQAHRCRRQLVRAVFEIPFLAPAAARLQLRQIDDAPEGFTMGVDDREILFSASFVDSLDDKTLQGCLAHELLHPTLGFYQRAGKRDPKLFNVAHDMAINEILRRARLSLPPWVLYPPSGLEDASAEQIYEHLVKNATKVPVNPQPRPGEGCGMGRPKGGAGKKGDEKGEGQGQGEPTPGEGQSAEALAASWSDAAAQARAIAARSPGNAAADLLAKQLTSPPPKASWRQLLRSTAQRAAASHGRDDQTWRRRSRRAPPGIILPGWCASRARVAVVIDTSGSMSDPAIARACAEAASAALCAEGVRVYLVVHDAIVQHAGWVSGAAPSFQRHMRGRGGTRFADAYTAVDKAGAFDACVHLTDGQIGYWPAAPRRSRKFIFAHVGPAGHHDEPPPGSTYVPVEV